MSKAGKLVKDIVKAKKESVMGKLGDSPYEDPMEPWSAKYQQPVKEEVLNEDGLLMKYIRSLGFNPEFMTFAQRSSYARSNAFKRYKTGHTFDRDKQNLKQEEQENVSEAGFVDVSRMSSRDVQRMGHADDDEEPARRSYNKPADHPHAVHINGKKWKTFGSQSHATNVAKKIKGATVHREEVEIAEMDKSAPQPGRDGRVSHSTYGSRDKGGSKGTEKEAKPITAKKAKQDALDILKKQGVTEEVEQLDEAGTGLLMSFIKSKGLNPLTMDGNQKKAYARSSEFRIFKMRHMKESSGMGERGDDWNEASSPAQQAAIAINMKKNGIKPKQVKEEVDEADTVTMDIPLLIRVLEYAREDAKTDMDLHKVVENLINMRGEGTLSMEMYNKIVAIKEEIEKLDELSSDMLGRYKKAANAQASAADKAGDYNKGNKRFSGIMKATRKQFDNDAKKVNELKNQDDNQELDSRLTREDLRKWFSKTDPQGDWKRINSKGEVAGPCAREPGEPKPKCMSKEKRAELSKSERAAAVATKRKHDPVADRAGKGGKPINVSNYGKGKLSEDEVDEACWDTHKQVGTKMKGGKVVPNCVPKNEEVEQIDEKNSPTNPSLWSRAKALARSKFDVYPSAYANGWASKWYKSKGGGWKSVKEDVVQEGIGGIEDSPMSATNSVKAMESEQRKKNMKSARIIKSIYKKKGKNESMYDWEKDDKPTAKITMQGGTTMTGKPRDTVEIEPVLKTRPNSQKQ